MAGLIAARTALWYRAGSSSGSVGWIRRSRILEDSTMVGIQGIGGVPEPKPERPAEIRDRKARDEAAPVKSEDGVVISSEAQAAASLSRLVQAANAEADIRADKVAEAKAALERGDYKNPEIVAQVAQRISKYL